MSTHNKLSCGEDYNYKYVENMGDLYKYSIKYLQQALQQCNCNHLSGAKKVLIHRLWKIIHPSSLKDDKIEYLDWDKNVIDPTQWDTIWVNRIGNTGTIMLDFDTCKTDWRASSQQPILLKVDNSHSPPIVLSETHKEYILEGILDKPKQLVRFGIVSKDIQTSKQYLNETSQKNVE